MGRDIPFFETLSVLMPIARSNFILWKPRGMDQGVAIYNIIVGAPAFALKNPDPLAAGVYDSR